MWLYITTPKIIQIGSAISEICPGQTNRRTDEQTDGRTDGVKTVYPPLLRNGGYNNITSKKIFHKYETNPQL